MMYLAMILSAAVGFWLGRRLALARIKVKQKAPHEWAAFGQGGSVHAAASFCHDEQGGYVYKPGHLVPDGSPGRIYLHSPP